jgi:Na+-translocating ferredoxin:NAD+ oxidoreductase RnfG subunit
MLKKIRLMNPLSTSPRRYSIKLAAAALIATALVAISAHATQYFTPGAVLTSLFKGATKISYKRVSLTDAEADEIAKKLGTASVKKDWSIYFGETDGKRNDGFAILDKELGMHEPIDFAVRFTGAGTVNGVEVMEYREAYGDEVRAERFRSQFIGKSANDPITVGKDIQIITGASISSRSMAVGIKRGVLVLEIALKSGRL